MQGMKHGARAASTRWLAWLGTLLSVVGLVGCSHETKSPELEPGAMPGAVSPGLVCTEQLTTTVTINGEGFTPLPSRLLEEPPTLLLPTIEIVPALGLGGDAPTGATTIKLPDDPETQTGKVKFINDTKMSFEATEDLEVVPAVYDIKVTNPDEASVGEWKQAVAFIPPPAITSFDESRNALVCLEQADQTRTLLGTTFLKVDGVFPAVVIEGADFVVTAMDGCTAIPGNLVEKAELCTSLTFALPQQSLEVGIYELSVRNPGTASCISSNTVKMQVVPPPAITTFEPLTESLVCVAQADQSRTLTGEGFLQIDGVLPTVNIDGQDFVVTAVDGCTDIKETGADARTCTSLTFALPMGSLEPELYDVGVTNPVPANCVSSNTVKMRVVPPPAITSFDAPNNSLVCLAACCQADTEQSRTLIGAGFLSIEGVLPTVQIDGQDFVVTALDGCTTIDETGVNAQTCTSLTFTLPQDSLAVGVYDVGVTNPVPVDCVSSNTVKMQVVPPPTITAFDDPSNALVCVAEVDQSRTLEGTDFLEIGGAMPTVHINGIDFVVTATGGCTDLTETGADARTCTSITFTIPVGSLLPAVYDVSVTNPAPADCLSTNTVQIEVVPPSTITGFDLPNNALACVTGQDASRTLMGTGFLTVAGVMPTVGIDGQLFAVTAVSGCTDLNQTGAVAQTCTSLTFTIPQGSILPGEYDVSVTNPPPVGCTSSNTVKIQVVAPPTIGTVQPPAICDDQADQTLVLDGSGFLVVDGVQPAVTVDADVVTAVAGGCTPLAPAYLQNVETCTNVTVTVTVGTLLPGPYDVTVVNPPPADCGGGTPESITVNAPPTVDSVVPATVCSGGGVLTVTGGGFLEAASPPSVALVPQSGGTPIVASSVACSLPDCTTGPGTQLVATFGPGTTAGEVYDVVVTNPDSCEDRPLPHKTITGIDGPILFFVDPYLVSNTVNTRITLFSTAIMQPLPVPAVWIVPTGLDPNDPANVTALQNLPINPAFPKRLQATVPAGQQAGTYDVFLEDASGCGATMLPQGLVVGAELDITLADVTPAFGDSATNTAITIDRDVLAPAPANASFVATPRVYLNPAASTNPPADAVAIQIGSVAWKSADQLTAVVPGGGTVPPGLYDLIVVNPEPTAEIGILADAYESLAASPPVIDSVTPPSLAQATGQVVTIEGGGFSPGANVSLTCQDAGGGALPAPPAAATTPAAVGCGSDCTITATIDASGLSAGAICILTVTNADTDQSFGIFSAIGVTNASLNLGLPTAGTPMLVGRRGLGAGSAKATNTDRYLYAIAGDDGAGTVLSSVESVFVDLYGKMDQSWKMQPSSLVAARVFPGSATAGRYIYAGGGSDGTTALASVERALVLSPTEAPVISDVDLVLGVAGLDEGTWIYRVSATFDAADTDNPGGESLASDEFVIKLPTILNKKIAVVLKWTAPKYEDGTDVPGVSGYRIFRTPIVDGKSGEAVLLTTVSGAATLMFTDDGTAAPGTETPLPLGSTGKWAQLPNMATAREGVAFAIAPDPASPDTTLYLYALLGKDGTGAAANTYEYLPISVDPSGRQTASPAWFTGAATATGRWRHGVWKADRTIRADIGSSTLIYIGGGNGAAAGTFVSDVDRALVQAGGELAITPTGQNFNGSLAGYGVLAAASQLFAFGGDNGAPSVKGISAQITNGTGTLANNSWNAGLSLGAPPRVFMGSTVQSAFAFFIGGQTDVDAASTTTAFVVW